MSPVSERDHSLRAKAMAPKDLMSAGLPFGIHRKQQEAVSNNSGSGSPLKVSKDSHRIRKPPLPLPQVQYRPPIIIHTYSPKVIHTEPDDFMSLVQKLTGSSDTRLRLKKTPGSSSKKKSTKKGVETKESSKSVHGKESKSGDVQSASATNLERQGSGNSVSSVSAAYCGSPSSSDDSAFLVSEANCESETAAANKVKQSNSPRSPFDSNLEFDSVSESMFLHFDPPGNPLSQVKPEPMFSFNETLNPFNFYAEFLNPVSKATSPLPPSMPSLSRAHQEMPGVPLGNAVHEHLQSPLPTSSSSLLSSSQANLMSGLPDFSPAWSQANFLDSLNGPSPHFIHQAPFQRQRFPGSYSLVPDVGSSTMVALDNIQAFMLT